MDSTVDCENARMGCGNAERSGLALRHHVVGVSVYGEGVNYGGIIVLNGNHEDVALIDGEGCGKYSLSQGFGEVQNHRGGFYSGCNPCKEDAGDEDQH